MFQGHPPQILENTPSSATANGPPSDINQTNTATHKSNHHNGNDTTRKISNIRTDRNNLRENSSFNKESTKNDQKFKPKRTIAIVGDSMVKNIYRPSYSDNKSNVFVKSISGAKTKCMKSYIIPTVELEPDAIVIHCGTNDLRRQEQPEEIAYEIANLTSSIKSKKKKLLYLVLFLVRTVLETRRKKQMKASLQSVLVEIFRVSTMEILILEPT